MPYDPGLAARLTEIVPKDIGLHETRMFGGFGYMLNGNMCFGIHKDNLLVRVGLDVTNLLLQEKHICPMDFTGRVMKGWATITPEAMEEDSDLARFCNLSIDFVQTLPEK